MNQNILQQDLVSVCICTFKRPELLKSAIDGVMSQNTNDEFLFELVIVDNDSMRSAEDVVKSRQNNACLNIVYYCEPEQNIALARNRAIRNAGSNLIAFIDDDEIPVKEWLSNLFNTLKTTGADGVLGPVLPYYPSGAPEWLNKCKLFDRRRFKTGTKLKESRDTRTGNVLFLRSLFPEGERWFNPVFGRTGGEDIDFFRKQFTKGKTFVWCDEAIAYETIPPERWNANFYIKRYFRTGTINGERVGRDKFSGITSLLKYTVAIPIWMLIFFYFLPFGRHKWFQPILKLVYFSGSILAFCGVSLLRERE
jgi:succinoglycan biosynthesis protein ExoM